MSNRSLSPSILAASAASAARRAAEDGDDMIDDGAFEADQFAKNYVANSPIGKADWQDCCDCSAQPPVFLEEAFDNGVWSRKYQFSYQSYGGLDNDEGYPDYDWAKKEFVISKAAGVGEPWKVSHNVGAFRVDKTRGRQDVQSHVTSALRTV
eukprot:g591.t1